MNLVSLAFCLDILIDCWWRSNGDRGQVGASPLDFIASGVLGNREAAENLVGTLLNLRCLLFSEQSHFLITWKM